MGKGIGSHQSGAMLNDEWLTPRSIINALGPFDLDPCAPVVQPWPTAARTYTVENDGLTQDWAGFVYCNPPYGRQTAQWLDRLATHGNGIALIFARTETNMFFKHAWSRASSMLFLEGRLFFHYVCGRRATSNAGAPSVLLGYGGEADRRLRESNIPGVYLDNWTRLRGKLV